mmetsp:Transcript_8511/g.17035  ORF Transcript_8511/g.17035 Transcript_8511/m.17035 type:complete len:336 (+) Transcript_8511:695-1702(+)
MTIAVHVDVTPQVVLVALSKPVELQPVEHVVELVLGDEAVAVGVHVLEHLEAALALEQVPAHLRKQRPHAASSGGADVGGTLVVGRRVHHLEAVQKRSHVQLPVALVDEAHEGDDLLLGDVHAALLQRLLELPRRHHPVAVWVKLRQRLLEGEIGTEDRLVQLHHHLLLPAVLCVLKPLAHRPVLHAIEESAVVDVALGIGVRQLLLQRKPGDVELQDGRHALAPLGGRHFAGVVLVHVFEEPPQVVLVLADLHLELEHRLLLHAFARLLDRRCLLHPADRVLVRPRPLRLLFGEVVGDHRVEVGRHVLLQRVRHVGVEDDNGAVIAGLSTVVGR